jgi:excisionase family DNA binding protein
MNLDSTQAAELIGVSRPMVYKLLKLGLLKRRPLKDCRKVVIPREEVDHYLAGGSGDQAAK